MIQFLIETAVVGVLTFLAIMFALHTGKLPKRDE